jgi:DNA-binding transcriptional MerR regulator
VNRLTAAELAAFLGISAAGVRQIVRRGNVPPKGKRGKAHLYDPADVLRHAGVHDRRSA